VSLVHPALLLLALLAVPLVVAFLRRPPPVRRTVSSLLLVRALASAPARRRRPPLRELLALALMLVALLLCVAGLATRPDPPPRGLLVVLDTSASAERRRGADLRALDAALRERPAAKVSLVASAPPQVLITDSTNPTAVRQAAESQPTAGVDGDLLPLLRVACVGSRPPTLLALTDALPLPLLQSAGCPVEAPALPALDENRGITALSARRIDGLGLVEVHLATSAPETVTFQADGADVGQAAVDGEALVRLDLPDAAALTARLPVDAWAADDSASVTLPAVPTVRTLLLTERPQGFAAAALGAHPGVALTVAAPADAPAGPWDLVVQEADVAELPAAPRVLVLGADPQAAGVRRGVRVRRPAVEQAAEQDPLLQYVDLEQLYIGQGWTLRPPEDATVLVEGRRGPLALRTPTVSGEALVLGFPLDDTDLVLRAAFVNLVANAVEWARPAPTAGQRGDGVLSPTESAAAPTEASTADRDGRPPLTASLAALLALVLLSAEWVLQWAWRARA